MTIRLLRTLVAVADTRTFSAAAVEVRVTHAAVSQQMQTLEADLGLALFNRDTRTPELTPIGHDVVRKARQLIADYDNLAPSVLGDDGLSGVVTLGALRTTLTGLTPHAMARLKDRFPALGIHIRPGLTETLLADISRGSVDAAIVTRPHLLPADIAFKDLAREPLQLIAHAQDPLDDPIALLHSRPFIRFNRRAVLGTLIENWLVANKVRVTEAMELDSPEAITSMVQANLGVSIVPDLVVKPLEQVAVKQVALGADAPTRLLGLAYRKDHIKTRLLDEVFAALSDVIAEAS
ncbi:LysR substrate-binding domain-containing protein [Loktanella sp. F6476L]|uniref:LysR substrate-binding domain-containing protein n=1 Tax=Loktanella sp. F6476L TaxID=2926405 RepID=UPI001FF34169|nr:LysR substrate-binding domain-containing protein [Loktanella sp. F6476L]MCK0121444.1 LysR substrate-binding domain-containing protein [Loktanella sp. F6476L]